jgi:hypothetical protein
MPEPVFKNNIKKKNNNKKRTHVRTRTHAIAHTQTKQQQQQKKNNNKNTTKNARLMITLIFVETRGLHLNLSPDWGFKRGLVLL